MRGERDRLDKHCVEPAGRARDGVAQGVLVNANRPAAFLERPKTRSRRIMYRLMQVIAKVKYVRCARLARARRGQ